MEDNRFLQTIQKYAWLNLVLRYVGSILVVLITLWLYWLLTAWFGQGLPTYILFYPAVIIVALLAGFGPGILTTILAVIMADVWILPPVGEFTIGTPINMVGSVLFSVMGVIISSTAELYRRNREKAEGEILRSKESFRSLAENSPDLIIRLDTDLRYVYVNSVITEITGQPPEYYIGKTYDEIEIPKEYNTLWKENNLKALETGEIQRYEFELSTNKGLKFFETTAVPEFNANGEVESLLILDRDITERKNAEDELRNTLNEVSDLYNNAPCGYYSLDKDGYFVKINDTGLSWLGYSREEIIGKKKFTDLITEEGIKIFEENFPVFKERGNVYDLEYNMVKKDGSIFPVNLNATAIIDSDGNYVMSRAIIVDISERKKLEEKLQETITELERSNQELQQFAYVSSHDLQEPLRTIASFTQLLERRYKGKLDSDTDEFMDYIVDAAVRMKQQIEDLLEYSRVTTQEKEFKPVDMNLILNQTIQNIKSSIEESNAKIIIDKLPSVMGDAGQLQRVFQNLISNAIKFKKPEEPPKIYISQYKSENGKEYVFKVHDNGIGIEEQYMERIFTIFQRLHTREEYEGTGIGLSIVKRIIERHGGRMWVESEFGVGSTFYFTIPT